MERITDILSQLHQMPSLVPDRFLKCLHFAETEWCHATMVTAGEVRDFASTPPSSQTAAMIALIDKHLLLAQSSFAGHVEKAEDLPMAWFTEIADELFNGGVRVKPDGSCHAQPA